uniref:Hydrogen voltage-gated channel 1 n=1 Tax=Ciona savignyi TaxID=51511 RepID=H2ZLT5_CIOSA
MASNATDIIETNPITDIPGTSTRDNTTVPPQPNTDLPSSPEDSSTVTPICCCGYARDESLTPEAAQHNGWCTTAPPVLRRFLNSVPVYIYILITTFIVVFLLLAELLIDLGIIVVPDNSVNSSLSVGSVGQVTPYIGPEAQRVSTILHWISFSILSLFFIEVVLRLYAWKLNIVRHIVSVIDCAVVTMSIATNIATTLAAGVTSPFDSISLIIILRFIHVYSLVKRVVDESRQVVREKLRKTESNLNEAQISIQRLN